MSAGLDWLPEHESRLRFLWESDLSLGKIAQAIGHSFRATYARAIKLKLGVGPLPGYESLHAGAKRRGYCDNTLKMIIEWAGINARGYRSKSSWKCYSIEEVDLAIEKWNATESLDAGASRHNIHWFTLKAWLLKAGFNAPSRRNNPDGRSQKPLWRVDPNIVDRVVNEQCMRGKGKKQKPKVAGGIFKTI